MPGSGGERRPAGVAGVVADDVEDVLVDQKRTEPRMLERYLGKEGATRIQAAGQVRP